MDKNIVKQEFTNLIEENRKIIFKIVNAYCANKNDREDLAQEIVLHLWKSYQAYVPEFKFTTWMYRVALNVAISFYRKEKTIPGTISLDHHLLEVTDETPAMHSSEENLQLLQQFIYGLKELDRALMILYLESKSYEEISTIIGITKTNVATRINRIKEQLKKQFSKINN